MRLLIRIMRVDASLHMIMMETPSFAMKSLHAKSITNRPSPSTRIVLSSCSSRSYYSACCGERALRCCKQYCTGAAVAALKPLPSDMLQAKLRGFSSSRIVRVPDDRISSSCSKSVRGCSDSSTVALNDTSSQDKRHDDANLKFQEGKRQILLRPDGAAAEDDDERRLFTVRENVGGGAIHVIMGPMFAGKTTSLLQRVQDARNAGRKVGLVKSNKDTRYGVAAVVSHDGIKLPCVAVSNLAAFRAHVGEAQYKEGCHHLFSGIRCILTVICQK
ncbi:hypothetical protein BDL97_01G038700 [Sphagnum fallax]|nr:hypothetical protein BDL97_01G038700 [Sphagnum fallax]